MNEILEQAFKFYIKHQDELVEKYRGKFLIIKGEEVIGVFDNELEAIRETSKKHELGTFIVKKCIPGKESYTQTFHSRVHFSN